MIEEIRVEFLQNNRHFLLSAFAFQIDVANWPTGCLADDEGDDIPAAEGWNYSCALSRKNTGMNDKKGKELPVQCALVQAQFKQKQQGCMQLGVLVAGPVQAQALF